MARLIATLTGGILIGILAMLAADRFAPSRNQSPEEIVRDIADVPKMELATAEKHRSEQYTSLTRIEEIVALPTEFARSSALYAIAGRSSSGEVQNLIFEANRIADDEERVQLLEILFFRLAEADPASALALARTDSFSGVKSIERTVWRAWARKDLDDALFAAKTQTSVAHQNSAAQSLYAAFGFMGNDITDRIEAELGIGPDRSSRGRFLYQLADKSPAEAIAFINGLDRGVEQQDYVSWLAYYVSLRDPTDALRYADLFAVAADGDRYRMIINSNMARENPHAVIQSVLAGGQSNPSRGEFYSAVRSLASTDIEAAIRYFEQTRSSDHRRAFGTAIAAELAKKDPAEALAWARENDSGRFPTLQMTVLGNIAETDPQLALTEALATPNVEARSNLIGNIVQRIARKDPTEAIVFLDQIPNGPQKLEAAQNLASTWMREDPDAAIEWILDQDDETAGHMIQMVSHRLVNDDLDMAMRLLPRLDEAQQTALRHRIAATLAESRSPGEAQAFVQQFEGQPGYEQLQASVIAGVARKDAMMAKQLADQLPHGRARDMAYVEVIAQQARRNPAEALRWLNNISDEQVRSSATGQLAAHWYSNDPAGATHWAKNLPPGPSRDDAIMHLSFQWSTPTDEQANLIASIADRDKRGQAKIRHIYRVVQTDPVKARELLQDEDIPSYMRQQAEQLIAQYGIRY